MTSIPWTSMNVGDEPKKPEDKKSHNLALSDSQKADTLLDLENNR